MTPGENQALSCPIAYIFSDLSVNASETMAVCNSVQLRSWPPKITLFLSVLHRDSIDLDGLGTYALAVCRVIHQSDVAELVREKARSGSLGIYHRPLFPSLLLNRIVVVQSDDSVPMLCRR